MQTLQTLLFHVGANIAQLSVEKQKKKTCRFILALTDATLQADEEVADASERSSDLLLHTETGG